MINNELKLGEIHPSLGGHLKTGHTWPLQNRPTKLSQNKSIYTAPEVVAAIPEVERIARVLHDKYKLDRIALGHCTGEPEFAALKKTFGDHYLYAGVGS